MAQKKKSTKKKKPTKPWESFHAIRQLDVRWRDLDAYNHATNSVYFNYFEEARIALFNKIPAFRLGWENKGDHSHLGSTLIRTAAEYRAQAFLGQTLMVAVKITRVKKYFIDTEYGIFDKKTGALIAKGTATNAVINRETFKPVTVPPEILKQIQKLDQ